MGAVDWFERWQQGRIGFHEGTPNRLLVPHARELGAPIDEGGARKRILVPLCGKSEDLTYLAQLGFEVVGVELVESAVRAFFAEHALTPQVEDHGPLRSFRAERITLWAGDFFACTRALLGATSVFYDRAALVALPAEMRPRYVQQVLTLVSAPAKGLVITFEYDQSAMSGPPFSVSESELRTLFADTGLALVGDASLEFRGGVSVREKCFVLGQA